MTQPEQPERKIFRPPADARWLRSNGRWHHVTFTPTTVYVDGEEVEAMSTTVTFDRALSDDEVRALYATPPEDDLAPTEETTGR